MTQHGEVFRNFQQEDVHSPFAMAKISVKPLDLANALELAASFIKMTKLPNDSVDIFFHEKSDRMSVFAGNQYFGIRHDVPVRLGRASLASFDPDYGVRTIEDCNEFSVNLKSIPNFAKRLREADQKRIESQHKKTRNSFISMHITMNYRLSWPNCPVFTAEFRDKDLEDTESIKGYSYRRIPIDYLHPVYQQIWDRQKWIQTPEHQAEIMNSVDPDRLQQIEAFFISAKDIMGARSKTTYSAKYIFEDSVLFTNDEKMTTHAFVIPGV